MTKKKSLTFLEILISAMLIATSLAGLMACFVSSGKLIESTDRRLVASNYLRQWLDSLNDAVRADLWDIAWDAGAAGALMEDGTIVNFPFVSQGINYQVNSQTNSPGAPAEYRIVTVDVTFDRY